MKSDSHGSGSDSRDTNRLGWWRTLLNDLSAEPGFPAPGLWPWKLLPLIFGILVTVVLVVGNYDLKIQEAIYRAGGNSWILGEHPFWQILYHRGPLPAIVLGISAILGLSLSWSMQRFGKWRRVYIFVALLLFLGPAVIVNFGLKDNWGRPRPIDVDSMGGKQPFENVFVLNESRQGKSFPCGHASTGYVLMAGFFIFYRHRRRLAYGWLIAGVVFGTLLGLARMFQGGHFLTDVIWVALICYYLALWLYYLLGLKDSVSREATRRRKMPLKVRLLIGVVALLSVIGVLLATPYRDERSFALGDRGKSGTPINFKATLALGQVDLVPSDTFLASKRSSGHGIPTSRVSSALWEEKNEDTLSAHYFERQSGWFHELDTKTKIELPWNRIQSLQIVNRAAAVSIQLGVLKAKTPLGIGPGAGTITIQRNGNKILWGSGDRQKLRGAELLHPDSEADSGLILNVNNLFTGVIKLID